MNIAKPLQTGPTPPHPNDSYLSRDVRSLGHHGDMTPAQLVLRGPERRTAALDLVENAENALPSTFENIDDGVRIPRFGGAALLKAAARALDLGFTVKRIEFDGQGIPTLRDEGAEDEASQEVLEVLKSAGPLDAQGLLDHVYENYMVSGIQFYSKATRSVILRRDGVILGKDKPSLWVFVHDVLETKDE